MIADTLRKIIKEDDLPKIITNLKKQGKKVVQCHGVFDIVHLGHIRHFNLAKKEGDVLLVTTTSDRFVKRGPGRPYFNEDLRSETLASLNITDYVCVIDAPTAIEFIKKMKPDVYVKGIEYKQREKDVTGKIYEEEEAIKSVGGRIAFTDDVTFSSSSIINSHLDSYPPRTFQYLKALKKRYSIDQVVDSVKTLKKMKALVIGDTIIDEYHYCLTLGKSSKGELLVNKYHSEERFAGGALAAANNTASICGQVDVLTVLGKEETCEDFIKQKLQENVRPIFFYRDDTRTTVKRRFVNHSSKNKLYEICYMNDSFIPTSLETRIIKKLEKIIQDYDVVMVADFGHGLITQRIIDLLCAKSKYLSLNVQTNGANAGFNLVVKYPKANCVCIDEMELRFAAHDRFGDVRPLSRKIYSQMNCEHIIATRGSAGSICYSSTDGFHETPAFSDKVIDTIGAGDAFFAFISPCFASGMPQEIVSFIGNAAGSLAVQIVCNREPVNSVDLIKFMTRLLK